MSLYDDFYPDPKVDCINCGHAIGTNWQSKDLDCILFTWKQGIKNPIPKKWDAEIRPNLDEYYKSELPDGEYEIYTNCEECGSWNVAMIKVRDGIWNETIQQLA